MGVSFSFYSAYNRNAGLTDEQVDALFTPVLDMVADLNIVFTGEAITLSVANYGSYEFVNMLEDHIRAAIYVTMDPSQPTQLIKHSDDHDGCNTYIYIGHDAMQVLRMELIDLNIEIKNLTRQRDAIAKQIMELKGE